MNTNTQAKTESRRALLGALAALTLTLGGLAASAGDAAAGGYGGGVRDRAGHSIGEEIPTLHGGLAGGIGGDSGSIVIPQGR